jgi:hypothetical protein
MIALCDCVICGTLECEHVDSWNMYGDESCDFRMQMCWFVTSDVLDDANGIEHSTGQRHPTGGTGRWFPPFSCITLMFWNNLFEDDIYYCVVMNVKPTIKYWLSCWQILNRLWNVDWVVDEY